jgi:hypothetical protein
VDPVGGGQDRRSSRYCVKEAGGEAPTVWSRSEVKKIQYSGGGMVLDWLDFGEKGSLGVGGI